MSYEVHGRGAEGREAFAPFDSDFDPYQRNPVVLLHAREVTQKTRREMLDDALRVFPGREFRFLPAETTSVYVLKKGEKWLTQYAINPLASTPCIMRGVGDFEMQPFEVDVARHNPWDWRTALVMMREALPWEGEEGRRAVVAAMQRMIPDQRSIMVGMNLRFAQAVVSHVERPAKHRAQQKGRRR